MLKILIVDDEAIVRVGLKSMIDWQAHGFELIGEANDGNRALELFRRHEPDIIITDLKMPVLDGLELIARIHDISSQCRIIVLSSYDDFALVREAMKLGAVDYLLKLEVEPHQLIKTLDRFRNDILRERETQMRQAQIHHEIQTNLSTLQRAFLKEMICGGNFASDTFLEGLQRLEIKLRPKHLYCLVLRVGHKNRIEDESAEVINSRLTAIISVCQEVISDDNDCYCFQSNEQEFVIVLSPKQDLAEIQHIVQACEKLVNILEQYLGVTVTIGIGHRAHSADNIALAYTQARESVQYRFYKESDKIILWQDIQSFPQPCDTYSVLKHRCQLEDSFLNRQVSDLCSSLDTISSEFSESQLSAEAVYNGAFELYAIICEIIDRDQLQLDEVLKSSQLPYHKLLQFANLSEVLNWLTKLKADLVSFIKTEENNNYPWIVAQATRFIEENHDQAEISLGLVAGSVGLTPSYFSTVFKEHVGVSYSDYLTSLRMEKAKDLLQTTSYRVYEISHLVGYPNHYYFNRIFKKTVGVTPLDYRKSNQSAR